MLAKTLLAATASMLLVGPPRIAVQTNGLTGDAIAMVDVHFHTDEDEARIYGTAYTLAGGRRVDRTIPLDRIDASHYRVRRTWTSTDPMVLVLGVEQGEGGKHGAAEALVRLARGGRVVGVDIPTERRDGHTLPRRITEREIDGALERLGTRAAD
jgi:hypothetical protein